MMKFFQKLGKSLMLPVACLPAAGILMGIGYILAPGVMAGAAVAGLNGYATSGALYTIGFFLIIPLLSKHCLYLVLSISRFCLILLLQRIAFIRYFIQRLYKNTALAAVIAAKTVFDYYNPVKILFVYDLTNFTSICD